MCMAIIKANDQLHTGKMRKMLLTWVNIGRDERKFKLASKLYMLSTQYDHFHTGKSREKCYWLGSA
jgi:hypothetical protein